MHGYPLLVLIAYELLRSLAYNHLVFLGLLPHQLGFISDFINIDFAGIQPRFLRTLLLFVVQLLRQRKVRGGALPIECLQIVREDRELRLVPLLWRRLVDYLVRRCHRKREVTILEESHAQVILSVFQSVHFHRQFLALVVLEANVILLVSLLQFIVFDLLAYFHVRVLLLLAFPFQFCGLQCQTTRLLYLLED